MAIVMNVVNASSQSISGTVTHSSGAGTGQQSDPITVSNLSPYTSTGTAPLTVRPNHDDYWLWQPSGSQNAVRVQQNIDKSTGATVLITDELLVVVTSSNGIAKTGVASASAAG